MKTKPEQVFGATRRCRLTLSPEWTSAVIRECKNKGFSVTSGIHAAVVCVAQKKADPDIPATKYTSLLPWDFRKYCPAPYNGADHAVVSYYSGFTGTIKASAFLKNAAQWQKIYSRNPTSKEWGIFDWHAAYVRFAITSFTQPPPPGFITLTEPGISSLGNIDQFIKGAYGNSDGGIVIRDVWLGVETLTRQILSHVWTRQGQMSFSACYNENFYDADFVEGYLQDVMEELTKGLGIEA